MNIKSVFCVSIEIVIIIFAFSTALFSVIFAVVIVLVEFFQSTCFVQLTISPDLSLGCRAPTWFSWGLSTMGVKVAR